MTDTAAAAAITTSDIPTPTPGDIMLLPSPRLEVLSFAVSVPASTTMDSMAFDDDYYYDEEEKGTDNANDPLAVEPRRRPPPPPPSSSIIDHTRNGIGMVGTILVLKTSYVVWFGWGRPTTGDEENSSGAAASREGVNGSRIVGSHEGSRTGRMGQLLIAMPPPRTGSSPAATSKLIGGDFCDDDSVARSMAGRLSQKCRRPVLVACQFDPEPVQSMGLDPHLLQARAAALAEKRIWELLKPYHSGSNAPTGSS